jgi:superoxide reductase
MPIIHAYTNISEVEKEAKKDYIDRHSPFISAPGLVEKGVPFSVTVTMGNEYTHPADDDHYIAQISLFNNETLLSTVNLTPQMVSHQKSNIQVSFSLVTNKKMKLTAVGYCTKHGSWTNDAIVVGVQ